MATKSIEDLIQLMENNEISKDDLLSAMNNIEFNPNNNGGGNSDIEDPKEIYDENGSPISSANRIKQQKFEKENVLDGDYRNSYRNKNNSNPHLRKSNEKFNTLNNEAISLKEAQLSYGKPINEREFLQRMDDYQHWRVVKRKGEEAKARELEIKECNFQPKTNSILQPPSNHLKHYSNHLTTP